MRRILLTVFLVLALPTAAFAAKEPVPGDTCGGGGNNANGFPNGVTNAWSQTGGGPVDGGIVNGMFCNGSTWTGVINFQSSGNVGIGTTVPSYPLEVVNANTQFGGNAKFDETTYSGSARAVVYLGNGWQLGQDSYANGTRDFYIYDNGTSTTPFDITATDKVGIGTISPAAKFDVAGEIRTTGNTLACAGGTAGAIRYNSSTKAFDYCGGATPSWTAFSGGSTAAGTTGQVQFNSGGALAGASGLVYKSSTGLVGIGTTSPTTLLQVGPDLSFQSNYPTAGFNIDAGSATYMTTNYGALIQENYTSGTLLITSYPSGAAGAYPAGGASLSLLATGYVGIGKTNPTVALDVAGDIHYSGSLTDVSDRRLKHSIQPLPDQLARLERLQPVSYVKNSDPKFRTDFGFIAQDVQAIYPDLVETDPTGLRSLNYVGLISPMVAGMQEQQREIRALWIALGFTTTATCAAFLGCFVVWRNRTRPRA